MYGTCSTHGEITDVYKNLVGKPGGRNCLGYLDVYVRIILQ
jgi:hypothetical protein